MGPTLRVEGRARTTPGDDTLSGKATDARAGSRAGVRPGRPRHRAPGGPSPEFRERLLGVADVSRKPLRAVPRASPGPSPQVTCGPQARPWAGSAHPRHASGTSHKREALRRVTGDGRVRSEPRGGILTAKGTVTSAGPH